MCGCQWDFISCFASSCAVQGLIKGYLWISGIPWLNIGCSVFAVVVLFQKNNSWWEINILYSKHFWTRTRFQVLPPFRQSPSRESKKITAKKSWCQRASQNFGSEEVLLMVRTRTDKIFLGTDTDWITYKESFSGSQNVDYTSLRSRQYWKHGKFSCTCYECKSLFVGTWSLVVIKNEEIQLQSTEPGKATNCPGCFLQNKHLYLGVLNWFN